MNLKKIRNLIVVSFLTAMMNNANTFADQQFTGGLIELQNAILGAGTTDLNRTFVQTENISLTENLHELSGAPGKLTIYSNAKSIDGQNLYEGFKIFDGQTFTTKNDNCGGGTLKNFVNSHDLKGSALFNNGTSTIYNTLIENNSISHQLGEDNTTSQGGAIFAWSGSLELQNSVLANNSITSSNNQSSSSGGAIWALQTAKINQSVFENNHINTNGKIFTADGGAYYNEFSSTIVNSEFNNNYILAQTTPDATIGEAKGGAIYNHGFIFIKNAAFKGNYVSASGPNSAAMGGAIYNNTAADAIIFDSSFSNNTATSSGGAIYNRSNLYIVSEKQDSVFEQNSAGNNLGNDIYNEGILYINSGAANAIFKSGIYSTGTIEINTPLGLDTRSDEGWVNPPEKGVVVLDSPIEGSGDLSINNGMLKILNNGSIGTSSENIGTLKLSNYGILNLANSNTNNTVYANNIQTEADSNSKIWLDVDLNSNTSDKLSINNIITDSVLNINTVRMLSDKPGGSVTILENAGDLTGKQFHTYTNNYDYTVMGSDKNLNFSATDISANPNKGLAAAMASTGERSFSLTDNITTTANITSPISGNLTVFGTGKNGYFISGNNSSRLFEFNTSSSSLNLIDVSIKEFYSSNQDGNVLNNRGTSYIDNSLITDNTNISWDEGNSTGGAIFNKGTLYIQRTDLTNNKSSETNTNASAEAIGGAIYNIGDLFVTESTFASNEVNTKSIENDWQSVRSLGGAICTRGENATYINNSIFDSNKVTATREKNMGSALSEGGAIYAYRDLYIYNSVLDNNSANIDITGNNHSAEINGGTISHYFGDNLTISNTTFTGNKAHLAQGFAITDVNNQSIIQGGLIYNESTNLNIINTSFKDSEILSDSKGGSIYAEIKGGVLYGSNGNTNIYNTEFLDNTITQNTEAIINTNIVNGGIINITSSEMNADMNKLRINTNTISLESASNGVINGGIYSIDSTKTSIASSEFKNNTVTIDAQNGESAIYGGVLNTNSKTVINDSIFENNTATINTVSGTGIIEGGAIFNNKTTLDIYNTTFKNNAIYADTAKGAAIYNFAGTTNIIASAKNIEISENMANDQRSAIHLESHDGNLATLNLNSGYNLNIQLDDSITSSDLSNIININKLHDDGSLTTPPDGSPTKGMITVNQTIKNASIGLFDGVLNLGKESYLSGNNLELSGGSLNLQNGVAGKMELNNFSVSNGSSTNLYIDVNLSNKTSDKISANYAGGTGTLNIKGINLLNDSTNTSTKTQILSTQMTEEIDVNLNVTKAFTPIYQYDISYTKNTGELLFKGGPSGGGGHSDFNPSILSGAVSANVGAYLSQINIYNEVLNRSELFMSLPSSERMLMRYQNKTAFAGANEQVFSPLYLPEEKGGVWFKQYSTFENIPLKNGPNVSNVGYGMLIGADSPVTRLKHGFDGYLTAYVGYNGSHQNYEQVGTYQNGGAIGVTGTVYKGNFFSALTASVGDSYGQASTMYGTDNFNTLLAGAALKSGYNFEFARGKYILQPSFLASYTFANTFDYSAASGMHITSDPLNAIQLVPGIKFIANLKNGWQPYIGVNMVFNIMDAQKFQANDVQLPQMSVAPYVEYGIGVQRRWGEKFSGYGQAMVRGGGRNGIALQFGIRYSLGK